MYVLDRLSAMLLLCFVVRTLHRGKVILTAAKQVAKWTMPSFVCRDNLGELVVSAWVAVVPAESGSIVRLAGSCCRHDAGASAHYKVSSLCVSCCLFDLLFTPLIPPNRCCQHHQPHSYG